MEPETTFLTIGKILRPRGLRGELKLKPYFEPSSDFSNVQSVFIDKISFKVLQSRFINNFWYLMLEGIHSLLDAEKYRNQDVLVAVSRMNELPKNQYYHHELRGLEVIDSNQKSLGHVFEVVNHPAVDYLVVENALSIPLSHEIIDKIDTSTQKVYLKVSF